MEKDGHWYLIDYGFAKESKHKDYKNYSYPNFQLMPLGLLIWLKGKTPTKSWKYIRAQIDLAVFQKFEINVWP
jgi:hypothetical protein